MKKIHVEIYAANKWLGRDFHQFLTSPSQGDVQSTDGL